MSTKPVTLPRWATNLTNNTPASSGQRDTGWTVGQVGVSSYFNDLAYWTYKWIEWLDDGDVSFSTIVTTGDVDVGGTLDVTGALTAPTMNAGTFNTSTVNKGASNGTADLGSTSVQWKKLWTRRIGLGSNPAGTAGPTDNPLGRALTIIGNHAPYEGEYISSRFGVWARKGVRYSEDFFSATTVPDGWGSGTTGTGGSIARDGTIPHTLNAVHTGATNGAAYIYTTNKFRLTDGFVARWRMIFNNSGTNSTGGAVGFMDPVANTHAMSFNGYVDNVTVGGPYFGHSFNYGGTLDATDKRATGSTVIDMDAVYGSGGGVLAGNVMKWYTLAVVGNVAYWSVFTAEPDGEFADDSAQTALGSSGAITIPTGLYPFCVVATGASGLGGDTMKLDYFEIVSDGRDG